MVHGRSSGDGFSSRVVRVIGKCVTQWTVWHGLAAFPNCCNPKGCVTCGAHYQIVLNEKIPTLNHRWFFLDRTTINIQILEISRVKCTVVIRIAVKLHNRWW